jgi:hypothetical protein
MASEGRESSERNAFRVTGPNDRAFSEIALEPSTVRGEPRRSRLPVGCQCSQLHGTTRSIQKTGGGEWKSWEQ